MTFEGWSPDSKRFVVRKTVIDTADDSVAEDVLVVVNLSSSGIEVGKTKVYSPRALEAFSVVKTDSVRSSDLGTKTFITGRSKYVYVDYATVIEDVEQGAQSYTIHRRIWTLDNGMSRMIFKEDESFSGVSTQRDMLPVS